MLESFGQTHIPEYGNECEWMGLDHEAVMLSAAGHEEANRSIVWPVEAVINGDYTRPRLLHPGTLERLGGCERIRSVKVIKQRDFATFELWAERCASASPKALLSVDPARALYTRRPARELLSIRVANGSSEYAALVSELAYADWTGQDTDIWLRPFADAPFRVHRRAPGAYRQVSSESILDTRGFDRLAVSVELTCLAEDSRPAAIIKPTVELFGRCGSDRPYRSQEIGTNPDVGHNGDTWRGDGGFSFAAVHTLMLGGAGATVTDSDLWQESYLPPAIAVRLALTGHTWRAAEFLDGDLELTVTVTGY
ncbi:hypothetical protein MYSTI_04161 [Myxococcus stipitatus DSM 14675]|uniref:Uncharacterized protein n=1 Tax=Myxococcus stipitatus (strain DSM 14675 / JCM 12634 / Mx s8) TaxID=1278073 RepID=L7U977_MYXSD|nr:hypothetical protein [Myxococcus stipitatus]AGC45461.1 hypothetical protein MYSTI_04161 [Myxococcus stipitatus DSM 14675]